MEEQHNTKDEDTVCENIILKNQEAVEFINKEKYDSALNLLKKAEKELEVLLLLLCQF